MAVMLFLAACQPPDLDTLDYPTIEPQIADLSGLYVPTPETLKDIEQRGHYEKRDISILFSPDGSITLTNIPDWWLDGFGKPAGKFINETGHWKPRKQQGFWVVAVDCRIVSTEIFLSGKKSPYYLQLILGDPDSGKTMVFVKQK